MALDETIERFETLAKSYESYVENINPKELAEWLKELKEAKRLLKVAVEDLNNIGSCKTCVKSDDVCRGCRTDYKWVHADEAFALIGEGCE